jgi:Pyruvate/2-oxoacid:ferredoxin oxidoreductase gamma subunit
LRDLRVANTFFLGMLSQFLPLSREAWLAALATCFKKAVEQNKDAFIKGADYDLE